MEMAVRYVKLRKPWGSLPQDNARGSILMLVLWSLSLLAAFAVILGFQVRQKAMLIKRLDERSRTHFIAVAGVKKAIAELRKWQLGEPKYAALNESWSNNPASFKNINIGGGIVNICYERINKQASQQESYYGLTDEESKIGVNSINDTNKAAMIEVLGRLFMAVLDYNQVQAQDLAACIVDWRDSDNDSPISFAGAENAYYEGLAFPYKARNAALEIPEELLLIKGMDQDIYNKIKNYVTIYGGGRVNINTASEVVLLALGLSESLVNNIVAFRAGNDGVGGTEDDNVFDSASGILQKINEYAHLSESEITQLSTIISQYLGVKSDNFSAGCEVRLSNSRNISRINCIMNRNGKILYWQE